MEMIYPSNTTAPTIHTCFVNGIKLDICEVDRACYNLLYNKTARYFLVVNDEHIVFYASAEEYWRKTGECRWDLFCRTRMECESMIRVFLDAHDGIARFLKRAEKPGFKALAISDAEKIRARMVKTFGVAPL